jgi:hypothetical protein
MDDLGEWLPGLSRVGASVLGADILVAEGEGGPHQPLVWDAENVLGRLPTLAVEPADRGVPRRDEGCVLLYFPSYAILIFTGNCAGELDFPAIRDMSRTISAGGSLWVGY